MDQNLNSTYLPDSDSFPPPHRLMPHQREVIWGDNHRFKVLVWHRRARKTTTALYELLKQAVMRVGVYWHVFPTFTEAKDAIWRDPDMLFSMTPKQWIERTNENELVIYLKNGSVVKLQGSDSPDRLRGAGIMGCILDE